MYNSEVKNNKYSYLTCRLIAGEEKVTYRNFVNQFLRYDLSVAVESVQLEFDVQVTVHRDKLDVQMTVHRHKLDVQVTVHRHKLDVQVTVIVINWTFR